MDRCKGRRTAVARFYRDHRELLRAVTVSVAVGFFFLLCFLGALMEGVRTAEVTGPLAWIAFAAALMFMTALNVAVGLVAAAGLLSTSASSEVTYGLHAGGFVLAAPVALAGTAFFAAISALSFASDVFPRRVGAIGVTAAIANIGALGGLLSTSGPLNSGNGAVGGILVPILSWLAWILVASAWWLREAMPG